MKVILWTRAGDAYCKEAIQHLQRARVEFTEKQLNNGYTIDQLMAADVNAVAEMPALFIDDKYVGGLREVLTISRSA